MLTKTVATRLLALYADCRRFTRSRRAIRLNRRYHNFAPFIRQTGERKAQTCALRRFHASHSAERHHSALNCFVKCITRSSSSLMGDNHTSHPVARFDQDASRDVQTLLHSRHNQNLVRMAHDRPSATQVLAQRFTEKRCTFGASIIKVAPGRLPRASCKNTAPRRVRKLSERRRTVPEVVTQQKFEAPS